VPQPHPERLGEPFATLPLNRSLVRTAVFTKCLSMFGDIGKEFVELTSPKFARIVAYAIGLTAIFLLGGQVLYVLNQLLDAVEGASPRAALQRLAITAVFTTVALYISKRLLDRWRRDAVLKIEKAGAAALEATTASRNKAREYKEVADRAWKEAEEAGVRMRTVLKGLREKGLLDDEEGLLDDKWPLGPPR